MRLYTIFLSVILFLVITIETTNACSIPAFQYALENWRSDDCRIIVFHKGDITPEQRSLLDRLNLFSSGEEAASNIMVTVVDITAEPKKAIKTLWETQNDPPLAWMVVCYPGYFNAEKIFWAGPLTSSAVESVLESPLRREIARKLLLGETAVWVLLESGNKEIDNAACSFLEKNLAQMAQTLELPEDMYEPDLQNKPDIEISFPLMRVSRTQKSEEVFIGMLLNCDRSLKDVSAPIVFPIYGRGRILYPLAGDNISEKNIRNACRFFIEPCSCTARMENPGIELLMSVDWERLIDAPIAIERNLSPLQGIPEPQVKADPEEPSSDKIIQDPIPGTSTHTLMRNIFIVAAAGILVVMAVTLQMKKK